MKTYLTLSAIALAATAALSSTGVMAEEAAAPEAAPVPDIAVTSNVGITSDYRFRGISQNNRSPSVQGGFDVAFNKVGLYVGTWGSNVNKWTAGTGSMEWDLYGGYKTEIVEGLGLDIGAIAYVYPGSSDWKANTQEAYVGLSYGPAALKVSRVLGDSYFASTLGSAGGGSNGAPSGSAKGTMYYSLTLSQEVAPKLTASVHAGYTHYTAYSSFSYEDYSLGLAYDLGNGFSASVNYFINSLGTATKNYADASGLGSGYKSDLGANGVAFSLTRSF